MQLNFIEKGNGFPRAGDVIVDHEAEKAYRVLPDTHITGNIITGSAGQADECMLNVEELDYDEYYEQADWEL